MMNQSHTKYPIVGVSGLPGSGKTTMCQNVAKALEKYYGIQSVIIPLDGYLK